MSFRYENYGTADLLSIAGTTVEVDESKSDYGSAFYQTQRVKCFDIPATSEIWIKCDIYHTGSYNSRFRIYDGSYNNKATGICLQTDGNIHTFVNDVLVGEADVFKSDRLQTYLLHMVSGTGTNGIVEYWVDGVKVGYYQGDVINGTEFTDIYLQSDNANNLFSNVIISDEKINPTENIVRLGYKYNVYSDTLREVRNYAYEKKILEATKVLLHFDESTTLDERGNEWTANNNPTISEDNAKFGKALQLNGNNQYIAISGLTLGGKDFTVDGWAYMSSKMSSSYTRLFCFFNTASSNGNKTFTVFSYGRKLALTFDGTNTTYSKELTNQLFHFAAIYEHSKGLIRFYINGVLVGTISKTFTETTYNYVYLGRSNYGDPYWVGTIDEFRIVDGVAVWTEDFTPPTEPYALVNDINVELLSSTQRLVKNIVSVTNDTARGITNVRTAVADTNRELCKSVELTSIVSRNLMNVVTIFSDTARNVETPNKHIESFNADTTRDIRNIVTAQSSSLRNVRVTTEVYNQTARSVVNCLDVLADTLRQVSTTKQVQSSTARNILRTVTTESDTLREVKRLWRYENYGTADLLLVEGETVKNEASLYKIAYRSTVRAKHFDIPATKEIWIKFDLYFTATGETLFVGSLDNSGTNQIRLNCISETNDYHRIIFANDQSVESNKTNQFEAQKIYRIILHMVSDATEGKIELFCSDGYNLSYTGNVNNGDEFETVYIQAGHFEGSTYPLVSNDIISNAEIVLNENVKIGPTVMAQFATVRSVFNNIGTLTNYVVRDVVRNTEINAVTSRILIKSTELAFDTIRAVIVPVTVSCDTARSLIRWLMNIGEKELPEVMHIVRLYSDVSRLVQNKVSVGTKVERLVANHITMSTDSLRNVTYHGYESLDDIMTAQEVIKAFVKSLDETKLSGTEALDEAVQACSGFYSMQDVIDNMIADCTAASSYTSFLKDYCGIILGNDDTGAITGSDAGGSITKTAESIVQESGSAKYPPTTTFTIRGLSVTVPEKSTLSTDEQNIIAGIYSWWIEETVKLIEESYGLSFTEAGTTVKSIDVQFENDSSSSNLAYVTTWWSDTGRIATHLSLTVNMHYFANISLENVNGASDYSLYLDRVIAHELTHALMSANIFAGRDLPTFVQEGLAELTHGIDDFRYWSILSLALNPTKLANAVDLSGTAEQIGDYAYAGGYILFRYLAKQASTRYPIPA